MGATITFCAGDIVLVVLFVGEEDEEVMTVGFCCSSRFLVCCSTAWAFSFSTLSAKALISHNSNSSSATQVSMMTGPLCLGVSGLFGRKALDRRPFL